MASATWIADWGPLTALIPTALLSIVFGALFEVTLPVWAFLWTFIIVGIRVARLQGWSRPTKRSKYAVNTTIGVAVAVLLGLMISQSSRDCADHISY